LPTRLLTREIRFEKEEVIREKRRAKEEKAEERTEG